MKSAKVMAWLAGAFTVLMSHAAPAVMTDDPSTPFRFRVQEAALVGAPDQSALNRPLTAADRLVARDGHFFRSGATPADAADDGRIRLFGINLSFGLNFPSEQEAVRLAKQLRKAGFNAVRLHHLDFFLGVDTQSPSGILTPGPYPTFNPVAVERLRRLIDVLASEGIYTNLNLFVSYRFRPEVDGVPNFGTSDNRLPIGSSVHVYHPRMVAQQAQYAAELLDALNLKGHPGLAMVEVSNEASLLAAWTRNEWKSHALPPAYQPVLQGLWNDWLVQRYGSLAAACAAWQTCGSGATVTSLPLVDPAESVWTEGKAASVWGKLRIWFGAPATLIETPPSGDRLRLQDFLTFLADTDKAYFDQIRAVVHAHTDTQVPVTGTQMYYGGIMNLDSNANMDYIDEHRYIDHPSFYSGTSDLSDWSMRNVSLTGGEMDILLGLSLRRDAAKPFVLSEFNLPFPNPRGAEMLPIVAAYAAQQDWDGLFFFDYQNSWNQEDAPVNFTLSGDWGKYALVGQSAEIFRRGLIQPLTSVMPVPVSREARRALTAENRYSMLETHAENLGWTPADAWQYRIAVDAAAPAGTAMIKPAAAVGQMAYDARRQFLTLDAPGVRGFLGTTDSSWQGTPRLQVKTQGQSATDVLMTALDAAPVGQSRHLLLSVGSPTTGTQPGSVPPRPKRFQRYKTSSDLWTLEPDFTSPSSPSGTRRSIGPAWLFRPALSVRWLGGAGAVQIFPLDGSGARQAPLAAASVTRDCVEGQVRTTVDLAAKNDEALSPWYEVVLLDAEENAAQADPNPAAFYAC